VEREEFIEEILIAPAERLVIDVLFERAGEFALEHRTPDQSYRLGTFRVAEQPIERSYEREFQTLRRSEELAAERVRREADFDRAPDKTLALVGEMPGMGHHGAHDAGHGSDESHSGHGPVPGQPGHPDHSAGHSAHVPAQANLSIEWEDTMPEMNAMSTPQNMNWKLIDRETGDSNHDIWWSFKEGDWVKVRIVNEPDSDHPMQHPIHIHGQRFLVLARDGARNDNLAWKDTVLLGAGETVDILVDMSNQGIWMLHCHIAEHLEGGMMFSFAVEEADRSGSREG
jgi:FtsP/CotA-like multicopper oxidase with cupredoxin domain